MDPTLLVLCMAIAYFLRDATVDTAYAVRGAANPRLELKAQKLRARETLSSTPGRSSYRSDRHGAAHFFSERWHDAWDDADAIVSRRRETKAAKRAEKQAGGPHVVSPERPETVELGDQPDGKQHFPEPPTDVPSARSDSVTDRGTDEAAPKDNPIQSTSDTSGGKEESQDDQRTNDESSEVSQIHNHEQHTESQPSRESPQPQEQKGFTMSVPSQPTSGTPETGETVSLTTAIEFAAGMAAGARDGVTKSEQSMAGLQAADVGPNVLSRLAQAQELLAGVAEEYAALQADLEKQRAVQEQYQANPDAGSKQFLLQD